MGVFTRANALLVIMFASIGGCGGPEPCATTADCRAGSVCGFSGRCGPLRPPRGARFAGSRWLNATDWGVTGPGPLTDRLRVGDRRESLLAFGPLPEPSRILRALLVLHPHESSAALIERQTLVVERTGPFRGGPLPYRGSTQPDSFAAARRRLASGPPRPVRVDVTEAARAAGGSDGSALYLLLRTRGSPLRFASPFHHAPRARPRIELLLH